MMKRLLAGCALAVGLAGTALASPPVSICDLQGKNCLVINSDGSINVNGGGGGGGGSNAAAIQLGTTGATYGSLTAFLNSGGAVTAVSPSAPLPAADANNAAFGGEVTLTVGTTYAAGRSLKVICTGAGNVSVTYADASTGVWPVVVGTQTLPIAVIAVNSSGTTATATYANLK